MTAALETVGLGRRYRTSWGLRDCTLSVPEGSITGLVGPNGAGKSTLLRLAAGLSRPTAGSVNIFEQEMTPSSTELLRRIGYLDQVLPLYGSFRVKEILRLGQKLNPTWDDVATRRWIDDLSIPMDQRVGKLSLGQQAQVALTLCMGKRPDLLLLDEPVASLDPLARHQLLQTLMGTVADRGTTVFLSSHIVSELEPVCDNLIILSSSEVQIAGTIDSLLATHWVLIGPRRSEPIPDLDVISNREAGRQTTMLVRGSPPPLGTDWRVLQPNLEEIVLAYLGNPSSRGLSTAGLDSASSQDTFS
jgi:ABC-2 type transport system ATP-binding protein